MLSAALCAVSWSACARDANERSSSGPLGAPPDAAVECDAGAPFHQPDAAPVAVPFGANCGEDYECDPAPCVDYHCSVYCDPDAADACRDVGGLCSLLRHGNHGCKGDLDSGRDADDAVLRPGDAASRTLSPTGDLDVFRLAVGVGTWDVAAVPAPGVDLAIEFYDARAQEIAAFDNGVAGATEATSWTTVDAAGGFVVVRHVGAGTGGYTISLDAAVRR
jgi:hypothetical protein